MNMMNFIAEKKIIHERIDLIDSDLAILEIKKLLDKLSIEENKTINLSKHYDKIANQYGDVLKKLAE